MAARAGDGKRQPESQPGEFCIRHNIPECIHFYPEVKREIAAACLPARRLEAKHPQLSGGELRFDRAPAVGAENMGASDS